MDSYVPLHLHTRVGSILDSMINPTKEKKGECLLSLKAKQYKMPALAITDHGSMAAVLSHYKTCKEYGIKPIIGCEFYVCDNINIKDKDSKYYHLVVLAKNNIGYQNLKKLSSIGYLDGFYYKPRIDFETLAKYSEGLIVLTACLGGELPKLIVKQHKTQDKKYDAKIYSFIKKYYEVFGDDFYFEIQSSDTEEQIILNKKLVDLHYEFNIPLVVTTDAHFLNKEDFNSHNIFININQDRDTENYKYCYVQTRQEIIETLYHYLEYHDINKALNNTYEVANKCNVEIELHNPKLPHLEVPIDYEDEADWLTEEVQEGLKTRGCLNKPNKQEYIDRVKFELDVIITKGFEGYFLILMQILKEAKKRGIPIGEGRGSAAGSLVAYCLGITNIDSVEFDLDFGRFLTMERKDLPDIDIDVATSKRGALIDLIIEMFGYENVSQIATFGTLASKAVIDAVGKVMGIDKSVCSELKNKLNENEGVASLTKIKEYKQYKEFIDACIKIEGCPRAISCHAGGVCISGDNKPTTEYSPVMLNKDNRVMTQFEMHDVEECNLVKYDMLGLTSLDYIDDCLKFIGSDYYSFEFDYNDKATFDMLSSGNNTGVFQADSNFAERVFTTVKPQSISEVADCVSIGRPDAIQFLEPYVNAKFKGEMMEEIHPDLTKILFKTYGCLIYQEQLMNIFKVFGGFSDGGADKVRRIVGKKKLDDLPQQLDKFKKGTIIKGYSQEVINKLVDFIEHNVSYSFNKSHGVAYGTTTYKTAYLKCHYPVEYMAAIINNQRTEDGTTDFDSIKRYIKAANTDGIEVVSPDVNVSGLKFTPIGNSITYGLGLIKSLSTNGSKIVVENRPYTSYESFLESVGLLLNKSDVESLIKANAFRNITNLTQMEQFELYYKLRFNNSKEENKPIKKINKTHIKYLLDNGLITPEDATNTEYCVKVINKERALQGWQDFKNKYCKGTALDWEMEVLNCHLSGSPFKDVVLSSWDKLPYDHNGYVGGVLISIKETLVKKGKSAGQKMCFLNIDVNGEIFDLVVFSNNYLIYKSILKTGNCIVCRTTKQGDKKGIVQGCELLNNYVKRTRSMQPQNVLERFKV